MTAWCAGVIHTITGAWDTGIAECRRAVERAPDPLNRAIATGWLGFVQVEREEAAPAIALLERSAEQVGQFGYRPLQSWFTAFLAEAHRINGQFDVAREIASKSLQIATDAHARVAIGWARLSQGRIANATGAHAEAEEHLRSALETFAGSQSRYEMGRTQLDLAVATHAQGKVEAAATLLQEAHELFGVLGVPTYVRRAKELARNLGIAL